MVINRKLRFIVYTAERRTAETLQRLLCVWAESACVHVEVVSRASLSLQEDGCSLIFATGRSLSAARLARLRNYRKACPGCGLVLLTDDNNLAINAYQCHPDALLRGPVTYQSVETAMKRCASYWRRGVLQLELSFQRKRVCIPLYQLYYAEAAGRNVILHCTGEELKINSSMTELEKQLPCPPFLRCQKSFIVHLGIVRTIMGGELILKNGRGITIARGLAQQVQEQLKVYQIQRAGEEGTTRRRRR